MTVTPFMDIFLKSPKETRGETNPKCHNICKKSAMKYSKTREEEEGGGGGPKAVYPFSKKTSIKGGDSHPLRC